MLIVGIQCVPQDAILPKPLLITNVSGTELLIWRWSRVTLLGTMIKANQTKFWIPNERVKKLRSES